jgi:hypothetical protein
MPQSEETRAGCGEARESAGRARWITARSAVGRNMAVGELVVVGTHDCGWYVGIEKCRV